MYYDVMIKKKTIKYIVKSNMNMWIEEKLFASWTIAC